MSSKRIVSTTGGNAIAKNIYANAGISWRTI